MSLKTKGIVVTILRPRGKSIPVLNKPGTMSVLRDTVYQALFIPSLQGEFIVQPFDLVKMGNGVTDLIVRLTEDPMKIEIAVKVESGNGMVKCTLWRKPEPGQPKLSADELHSKITGVPLKGDAPDQKKKMPQPIIIFTNPEIKSEPTREEIEEMRVAQEEKRALEARIDEINSRRSDITERKQEVRKQLASLKAELEELNKEEGELEREANKVGKRLRSRDLLDKAEQYEEVSK